MKRTTMLLGVFLLSIPVFYGQEVPKFSSEAEKAAWIQTHPKEYEQISGTNVEAPQFTTEKEKEAWIKANPEQYQSMGGEIKSSPIPEFKSKEEKDRYFENQSRAEKDAHRKAMLESMEIQERLSFMTPEEKAQWIEEHPEEYRALTNESIQETEALTPEERYIKYNSKN